jgi:hypothetical protein
MVLRDLASPAATVLVLAPLFVPTCAVVMTMPLPTPVHADASPFLSANLGGRMPVVCASRVSLVHGRG